MSSSLGRSLKFPPGNTLCTRMQDSTERSLFHCLCMLLSQALLDLQTIVDAMREMLQDMDQGQQDVRLEPLQTLVEDTLNLQQSLAALNPSNYLKFQVTNLDGENTAKPTAEHWAHVLVDPSPPPPSTPPCKTCFCQPGHQFWPKSTAIMPIDLTALLNLPHFA